MIKIIILSICLTLAVATPLGNIFSKTTPDQPKAVCVLTVSDTGVTGSITFTQLSPQQVQITGSISGLTPGKHGFHIHELGNLEGGCGSTGSHYNPFMRNHGAPSDNDRHAGDLGNIEADTDGQATIDMVDKEVKLMGFHSVVGRSCLVHAKEDDLGQGGNEESKKTGNAGARIACGVIGVA